MSRFGKWPNMFLENRFGFEQELYKNNILLSAQHFYKVRQDKAHQPVLESRNRIIEPQEA